MKEKSSTFYTAMLVFAPGCWEESNRLFLYNKDRDNSFKRYMREHTKEEQAYGANLKALIDFWMESYRNLSAEEFLNTLIIDKHVNSSTWIQCIVKNPCVLDEAWNKRIYKQNGHVIMAQRKTRDSHCFDPILVYLRNLCISKKIDEKKFKLHDSKGEYEHAFQLEGNDHRYFIEWYGTNGNYSVKEDDLKLSEYSPKEMVTFMENVIKTIS